MNCANADKKHSPPRRGGREARARQGEASIEDRRNVSAELTTYRGFALSGSRFAPGAPASIKLSRHPSSARRGIFFLLQPEHDHVVIRRISIQSLHNRGTSVEHGSLVDVAFVRNLTRIDRARLA